ncbi:MAG: IS5/IS1182 family transposase, partial [Candidatus Nomurabacteria bacterium]|nr:IS5/IS1182 family transposase [Candidatus Nomurabacteria bacterium]
GDGAYDVNDFYQYAGDEWFYFIAPPPKNATIRVRGGRRVGIKDEPGWEERNAVVTRIGEIGMDNWKREVGYHRRSLVQNTFFRLKTIFGDKLKSRTIGSQYAEQCIRASLINRFNQLGLPRYAG